MKKLPVLLLFAAIMVLGISSNAQYVESVHNPYTSAIGLRMGFSNGLMVRNFVKPKGAIDVWVTGRYGGVQITGMYEFFTSCRNPKIDRNWSYFGGIGLHAGTFNGERINNELSGTVYNFGVDGIIGLEYSLPRSPFGFGFDIKPKIDFFNPTPKMMDAGVHLRYIIR